MGDVGKTVIIDGVEYEVVWAGGEGLTADRETKNIGFWVAPPRLYNKTGKYSKKKPTLDNEVVEAEPCLEEDDDEE